MQIGEGDECLTEKWVNILGIVAILVGTVIAILVKSYSTLHAWITKMFLITLIKLDKLTQSFIKFTSQVGMLTDKIKGFMKVTIFALLTIGKKKLSSQTLPFSYCLCLPLGGILFTLLSLVSIQAIVLPTMQSLKISVYSLLLLGNSMVVSTSPLCMEFAVEKLYPVPEVIQKQCLGSYLV